MSKPKKYYYFVYGLAIQSDIEISEFIETSLDGRADEDSITIQYGIMAPEIKLDIAEGKTNKHNKEATWFHIKDVATYYIYNGKYIIVEPTEQANPMMMKVYLMCSCLGFIMLQRNEVAIHGGAVVIDNQSIIITGDRGAGKSTLTTALRQKGYKFLADDVAATTVKDIPFIHYGFPYQKICEDMMEDLGYDKSAFLSFGLDDKVKYMVPAKEEFVQQQVPLKAICQISKGDVQQVIIEEVKGKDKLLYIIKNIYRGEFLKWLGGMDPILFKQCVQIAKQIKCYHMVRPKEGITVEEQMNCIEKFINH